MVTPVKEVNTKFKTLPLKFQVQCDFCRELCSKSSFDIGEASEEARKKGWDTIRTGKLGAPKKWACPCCLQKPETFS